MVIRKILLLAILAAVHSVQAKQVVVTHGGEVHMQGQLVNGACTVAPESQDMTVQMGQYPSNAFKDPGSYAPQNIPFIIRLTDCRPEVYDHVGIMFQGDTPAEDPQVFLATSGISGSRVSSGIGLALFDEQRRLIIPNSESASYVPIITREMTLRFTARYRAVSKNMTPGNIRSDVWFTLVYP